MFSLSSSQSLLATCRTSTWLSSPITAHNTPSLVFTRGRHQLAPRQVKFLKRHKGVLPIPTGGSTKGTTLAFGDWGIRIKGNGMRLTAKQLTAAEEVLKRQIKAIKGAKVYMRVFPDIPVCIKGNETRMGKGKGSFEFWATRVAPGRVLFELGGAPIREELAREALRLACDKLPTKNEFIDRSALPRLGNLLIHPEATSDAEPSKPHSTLAKMNPPVQEVTQARIDVEKGQDSLLLAPFPYNEATSRARRFRPLPKRTGWQRCARATFFVGLFLVLLCLVHHQLKGIFHFFIFKFIDKSSTESIMPNNCVHHANWSMDPDPHGHSLHTAQASFELPISSDSLYLIARGALSHGSIEISDSGEAGSDVVRVDISAFYYHEDALDRAEVCLLQPEEGKNGVGIFTPPRLPLLLPREDYQLSFKIHLRLPLATAESRLTINRLETDLPIFVHQIGDIGDSVLFKSLSLRTTNVPIVVGSLAAEYAELSTTNGNIQGSFNTSTTLELITSNGAIHASVGLFSRDDGMVTRLLMKTSNGKIDSSVNLVSSSENGTGGAFQVGAYTSNAPISITHPSAPVDSVLHLEARTSNSPAIITMHKTFEGSFSLTSSPFIPPSVEAGDVVEDPAHRGRRRSVDVHTIRRGQVEGRVAWLPSENDPKAMGSAKISTSNAGLRLIL
ncbi:54S ribosomal protein L16, mitochondrial [Grifola frondosa]|uniref:54S ribosomal protein L16, mitochondrial n=1 Tax=Grifola frondosa TaxID=5627 RepID=A0A1C7MM92_GRIFR|nr:54S ribosomal protein L16, mitochondrial [Grifola frondosa]